MVTEGISDQDASKEQEMSAIGTLDLAREEALHDNKQQAEGSEQIQAPRGRSLSPRKYEGSTSRETLKGLATAAAIGGAAVYVGTKLREKSIEAVREQLEYVGIN